ncbi:MAG TPA: amidohydrolase family protein [Bacteroidota bacterium]|nr:amidohydrolase family protein [Bacteroidota bacterium]
MNSMISPRLRTVLALAVLLFLRPVPVFTGSGVTAIRCGGVIDVNSGKRLGPMVIIVEDNIIKEVGPDPAIPRGAEIVDLGDATVLPGLIDCHTHLLLHDGPYSDQLLKESIPMRAILGVEAARRTLDAGFTTVRDMETEGAMYADADLRDAVAAGHIPGPRIFACTRSLVTTGSYAPFGMSWELDLPHGAQEADGVEGVRLAVREQISHGADWIKIYADSRYRNRGGDSLVGTPTFTDDELKAIVDEAEREGVHVAAHCYTAEAAMRSVLAGVKSIEHGLYLDDPTFALMKAKGVFWVPTLIAYYTRANDSTASEAERKRYGVSAARHRESFARGLEQGVAIAFGTDMYSPHGAGTREFGLMVDYGMKPMDAIVSATRTAAQLLGLAGEIGSIEPGKAADIIAVRGNPLENIRILENVSFVMKGGTIYKRIKE